jgi:hypothetical protein
LWVKVGGTIYYLGLILVNYLEIGRKRTFLFALTHFGLTVVMTTDEVTCKVMD